METSQVIVTDINEEKVKRIEKELSISGSCDNQKAAAESHIVILAVKPQFYKGIIKSIQNVIKPETIIVSNCSRETLEKLERGFKEGAKIIRAMPNTPAMVLEGMTALCGNSNVTKIEMEHIKTVQWVWKSRGSPGIYDEFSCRNKWKFSGLCMSAD